MEETTTVAGGWIQITRREGQVVIDYPNTDCVVYYCQSEQETLDTYARLCTCTRDDLMNLLHVHTGREAL
jgi:hypothetical protein